MSKKAKALAVVLVLAVVAAGVVVYAVQRHGQAKVEPALKNTARVSTAATEPGRPEPRFAAAGSYDVLEREDGEVTAAVADYTVKPGLANVENMKLFKAALSPEEIALIERNKFVVTPTDYTQMFYIYENNEYQRPEKFPSFITTDSMLHTYHIFYDYTLRQVESKKLYDAAVKLTDAMLAASKKDLAEAQDRDVTDAARRNVAYFAVARNLLTGAAPPTDVEDMANADLAKIRKHAGRDISDVFGHKMDFSQFVPRGHYTRTEKLKKYFKAMMWYGLAQFPIPQGQIGPRPTRQALLVVRNLRTVKAGNKPAISVWDTIYEPTAFYVGTADDYTVFDYSRLMDRVYGKDPSPEDFADRGKLDRFIGEVKKLPGPKIENFVAGSRMESRPDPYFPVGRQFRLMGQRFIPDSRVMQELTHPKARGRNFPRGLDVLAAMGSDRALEILEKTYDSNAFTGFQTQMVKMRKEMRETPQDTWQSNLYWGWLWSLQSVTKPTPQGYPAFMRSSAWLDKCLLTALGSWTELRHDTILYAKQSVVECGGDGEEPPPTPKGYVEPNLEFWTRLKWLNEYTKEGLDSRGLLDEELKDKFSKLGDWLDFCRKITVKELTNRKVTEEEYNQICLYGAELESLLMDFAGGDLLSDEDKDMAVVADVHTSFNNVMEEGTGRAAAIYVVVPIGGKLYLTRGAVYTQYEFQHPASDRLTDKQWQKMLQENRDPGLAEWMKTFMLDKKKKLPPQFENYPDAC